MEFYNEAGRDRFDLKRCPSLILRCSRGQHCRPHGGDARCMDHPRLGIALRMLIFPNEALRPNNPSRVRCTKSRQAMDFLKGHLLADLSATWAPLKRITGRPGYG